MKKFISWKILATIIIALFLGFFDLPANTQKSIIPFTPDFITKSKIHLGLDLQGGSQLDYKIDLREVPDKDQESIVEGVKAVIERRVNGLGVAEPNIYVSNIGDEYHITVELAETATISQEDVDTYLGENKVLSELTNDEKKLVSLEKAKATVGKTIQLEFKEEKDSLDPLEKDKVKEQAVQALGRIKNGEDFSLVGQEESQAYPGKVTYEKSEYLFKDEIPEKIRDSVIALKIGEYTQDLVETGGTFIIDESGQTVEETGLSAIKLVDTKEEVKNAKEVYVSHILISYAGLESADASITRTEEEAYDLIKDLQNKIQNGADFAAVAKENSADKSNAEQGGKLLDPVTGDGFYVYDFEQAALGLSAPGELSEIVKTKFGYHLIKADEIKTNVSYPKYQYELLTYSTIPDPWKQTGLTGKHFVHADVQLDNFYQPSVSIQFNEEGAKLFEEITDRNVGKRVAIFVGGDLISAPRVNEKIAGGSAQITGDFTNDEAKALARDLNTGAIPAPIILSGEYTIGATLGEGALNQGLKAGVIGFLLVMIFMILYYRAAGLMADIALAIYAAILLFLIKAQLHIGLALLISLIVFIFLVIKIVNNKDSGWEKFVSFILSCFTFFFLTYLLKTGVVLTAAGIAGIIMSIGMAVDANVLIFERFKEEIKQGKSYAAALDTGFTRAWDAIRDSNFSTLITCAILFFFGSSIIKGFAFNLSAGILVSMFTAITITKTLMQGFIGKQMSHDPKAFGINLNKGIPKFKFINKSKLWFTMTATSIIFSILAISIFGLNLGLDFKGGTLLEFNFKEPVTKEALADAFKKIEKDINSEPAVTDTLALPDVTTEASPSTEIAPTETLAAEPVLESASEKLDLTKITILEVGTGQTGYIVKTKYLTSEIHEKIITKMKEMLPEFTEPRFTTIGPVIGQTLLKKAVIAIFFAIIMMIVFIGLAFRKIPKEVNPWRFGVTAIIALAHDVLFVMGIFAILGKFLNVEIDALFITAMLTVLGYSVNDTIIIFDRLRENLIHQEKGETLTSLTDKSLNETLNRSLNTTITTLITLVSILILGSSSVFYFVLALTIGIAVGAYSSIFVAPPILVKWIQSAKSKEGR